MTLFTSINDLAILLIEPSRTQLKVIRQHLQAEGVERIDGVCSGKEALQMLDDYRPDLIISAMYLPDMTATELVQQLRCSEQWLAVPFMLVSSETHFDLLDPICQAGVVAILPKPFDHADLRRALRSTIEFIDPKEVELHQHDIDDLRILVVDDSSMARKHIQRVLSNMGITRMTFAENGREALSIFRDGVFDVVITDLNMPEMDGKQLAEAIRKDLGNREIPILLVTSEQDMARLSSVEQAGVSAICDKPFEPQNIKEMLIRLLDAD